MANGYGSITLNWSDWVRSMGQLYTVDKISNVPCSKTVDGRWHSFVDCNLAESEGAHCRNWSRSTDCNHAMTNHVILRSWGWDRASNLALGPKAVNAGSGAWHRALRTFWSSDGLCSKDMKSTRVSGFVRGNLPSNAAKLSVAVDLFPKLPYQLPYRRPQEP